MPARFNRDLKSAVSSVHGLPHSGDLVLVLTILILALTQCSVVLVVCPLMWSSAVLLPCIAPDHPGPQLLRAVLPHTALDPHTTAGGTWAALLNTHCVDCITSRDPRRDRLGRHEVKGAACLHESRRVAPACIMHAAAARLMVV